MLITLSLFKVEWWLISLILLIISSVCLTIVSESSTDFIATSIECFICDDVSSILLSTSFEIVVSFSIPLALRFILSLTSLMDWTIVLTLISISDSDFCVRSASFLTSSATTAKPRPCSPALAASIAAFSAKRFVCSAISFMTSRTLFTWSASCFRFESWPERSFSTSINTATSSTSLSNASLDDSRFKFACETFSCVSLAIPIDLSRISFMDLLLSVVSETIALSSSMLLWIE